MGSEQGWQPPCQGRSGLWTNGKAPAGQAGGDAGELRASSLPLGLCLHRGPTPAELLSQAAAAATTPDQNPPPEPSAMGTSLSTFCSTWAQHSGPSATACSMSQFQSHPLAFGRRALLYTKDL